MCSVCHSTHPALEVKIVGDEQKYQWPYRRVFGNEKNGNSGSGSTVTQLTENAIYRKVSSSSADAVPVDNYYYILGDHVSIASLCLHWSQPFLYMPSGATFSSSSSKPYNYWYIEKTSAADCQPSNGSVVTDVVIPLVCNYNNNSSSQSPAAVISVAFVRLTSYNSIDYQTSGISYTCAGRYDRLHVYQPPPITGIQPYAPTVLMFFNRFIYQPASNTYSAISTNSLFAHHFVAYKKIDGITLKFCVNERGHVISAGDHLINEEHFKHTSLQEDYRLLMNISPFLYFGTIYVDALISAPQVTCSFVLND